MQYRDEIVILIDALLRAIIALPDTLAAHWKIVAAVALFAVAAVELARNTARRRHEAHLDGLHAHDARLDLRRRFE